MKAENKITIKILTQKNLIDAGCFDINKAINICEQSFIENSMGNILFPDKISVVFNTDYQNRINCLPAGNKSKQIYGMKWVSVFPENPLKRNLPNVTSVILLSSMENGLPIAFLEGSLCTNLRTASVGAIAAKYLANRHSKCIGLIGAGEQAKTHFLTMMKVLPEIEVCKIASRTLDSEKKFVKQMSKYYPNIKYVMCQSNFREAVIEADIIITAISAQKQILQSDWIKKGAFYCHVAGLEDDFDVVKKADKIVCDSWSAVKHRTQTISQMYNLGLLHDDDIYADLDEIILGKKQGRQSEFEFIYFNSVGLSYLDLNLANWMYQKANQNGKGHIIIMKNKSIFE